MLSRYEFCNAYGRYNKFSVSHIDPDEALVNGIVPSHESLHSVGSGAVRSTVMGLVSSSPATATEKEQPQVNIFAKAVIGKSNVVAMRDAAERTSEHLQEAARDVSRTSSDIKMLIEQLALDRQREQLACKRY